MTGSQRDTILSLRLEGLLQQEIALKVGLSQQSVSGVLKASGQIGRQPPLVPALTSYQRSVLIGTLLGDGCLMLHGRNPRLQLGHSEKQRSYLEWKVGVFAKLFEGCRVRSYKTKLGYDVVNAGSRCHPVLIEFYKLFYSRPINECSKHVHKKRITPGILSMVDDLALAIWWADDGVIHDGAFSFCVGGLVVEEYELVERWFGERGFKVTRNNWLDNGNVVTLRMSKALSVLFRKVLESHLPESIRWKMDKNRVSSSDLGIR